MVPFTIITLWDRYCYAHILQIREDETENFVGLAVLTTGRCYLSSYFLPSIDIVQSELSQEKPEKSKNRITKLQQ